MKVSDYTYHLPQDRIATHPLANRDASKLLVFRNGQIHHQQFLSLPDTLPADSLLVFNNTKVIPARLIFRKQTGATIEIFLLEPVEPSTVLSVAMDAKQYCSWRCAIGNLKRWTEGTVLSTSLGDTTITATLRDRQNGIVRLEWSNNDSFAEVIAGIGETPLPPYLNRKAEVSDKDRYQTVFSKFEGAVAAPTAGLHFNKEIMHRIAHRDIPIEFLTLHVSAGTFMPMKTDDVADHLMHREQVVITLSNINNLLNDRQVIAVGTTSMRTLESLYWFGVKLIEGTASDFDVNQDDPYTARTNCPSAHEALKAVRTFMISNNLDPLIGSTSIFIRPGYQFRMCKGLVTNFHQPASTLILLVAAFVGENWRKIYDEALSNGYRFLSYGDSSLLLPGTTL